MLRLNAVHFAVCLLPLALTGCGEPADHDDPRTRPPLVRVATVERAEASSRAFTGVVVARTQSDLGFRVAGKVLERLVETGQSVRRGQLLLRLDPADLALQAQSQQRAVDAARARAKKAANDLARLSRPGGQRRRLGGGVPNPRSTRRQRAGESRPQRGSGAGKRGAKRHRLCRTAGGR